MLTRGMRRRNNRITTDDNLQDESDILVAPLASDRHNDNVMK